MTVNPFFRTSLTKRGLNLPRIGQENRPNKFVRCAQRGTRPKPILVVGADQGGTLQSRL
jgi:hypothetical protein